MAAPGPGAAADPARVVGPDRCGECHIPELHVLAESRHAKGFADMAGSEKGQAIAAALGIARVKRDVRCVGCHFTEAVVEGETRAVAGVSCESCHGAARGWLEEHYDFGPPGTTAATEPAAHREARHAASAAAGLNRPADSYRLLSRCFACHVVTDADLVDRTAHPARSALEVVAWTQGAIRHNYLFTPDQTNRSASLAHRRLMFVLGRALDLEWSLRAAGRGTAAGRYLDGVRAAVAAARARLDEVADLSAAPELEAMRQAVRGLEVTPATREASARAAAAVGALAERFARREDGSGLGALDRMLPKPAEYRGTPVP